MTFAEHLKQARGNPCKAAASYCREREWHRTNRNEWYLAWPRGLADEVEAAIKALP